MVKLPKELLFAKDRQCCQQKVVKLKLLYNFFKLSWLERSLQNKSILGILRVGSEEGVGRGKEKNRTISSTDFNFSLFFPPIL